MPSVVFSFKPESGEDERKTVLARLRAREGVTSSAKLSPETTDPEIGRMAFVETETEEASKRVLEELRRDPLVESADPPARRGLA